MAFWEEETHLWKRVIALKNRVEGGGCTMKPVWRTHRCSLWRNIRVGWDRFVSHVHFEVGNGERVWFSHDGLCGKWGSTYEGVVWLVSDIVPFAKWL